MIVPPPIVFLPHTTNIFHLLVHQVILVWHFLLRDFEFGSEFIPKDVPILPQCGRSYICTRLHLMMQLQPLQVHAVHLADGVAVGEALALEALALRRDARAGEEGEVLPDALHDVVGEAPLALAVLPALVYDGHLLGGLLQAHLADGRLDPRVGHVERVQEHGLADGHLVVADPPLAAARRRQWVDGVVHGEEVRARRLPPRHRVGVGAGAVLGLAHLGVPGDEQPLQAVVAEAPEVLEDGLALLLRDPVLAPEAAVLAAALLHLAAAHDLALEVHVLLARVERLLALVGAPLLGVAVALGPLRRGHVPVVVVGRDDGAVGQLLEAERARVQVVQERLRHRLGPQQPAHAHPHPRGHGAQRDARVRPLVLLLLLGRRRRVGLALALRLLRLLRLLLLGLGLGCGQRLLGHVHHPRHPHDDAGARHRYTSLVRFGRLRKARIVVGAPRGDVALPRQRSTGTDLPSEHHGACPSGFARL